MGECNPMCKGAKLLVLGLVLILVRQYTTWDIWVVIGVLAILKALMLFFMPWCPSCNPKPKGRK
jgi:hypothetical protein